MVATEDTINKRMIKGIPVNCNFVIKFVKLATIIGPIFVYRNKLINVEAKKIKTKAFPMPSKE